MVISFGIPFLIFPLYQGIIQILNDRENKSEIKKIRRALVQLEGEPSEIVDI